MHLLHWSAPEGSCPTLVFCHGFPGNTMHEAMFADLRKRGYGVLLFRYQGAFEAPGVYSFAGCLDDIVAASNLAKSRSPNPIVLIGYSTGGHYTVRLGVRDPSVASAMVLMGAASDLPRMWKHWDRRGPDALGVYYREGMGKLHGDPAARYAEALRMRDGVQPIECAPQLRMPILVLHGRQDEDVPYEHAQAFAARAPGGTWLVTYDTDHDFNGAQMEAARDIHAFLRRDEW
ncbi:MAG: alpha/beta hydrolase family protein [Thermoplasmatota archaeon]